MTARLDLDLDEMRRLWEQEWSAKRIAEHFGVSLGTAHARLRAMFPGPLTRTTATARAAASAQRRPIDETRLRELVAEGKTCREMAVPLGVSEETVRRTMKRLGLARLPAKARMEHNHFWRGGRTQDRAGYWLVKAPGHPYATKAGYVREHRLVVEATLGRYLLPGEVVDHIDGNTSNNDPANLRPFPCNADHLRATLTGRRPAWSRAGQARMLEGVRRSARRRAATRTGSGTDGGP